MPTSVVTGGAGFLGSNLCDYLLGRGHRVIYLDNLDTGSLENIKHLRGGADFRFEMLDITEHYEIDEPVDFVYHMASPARRSTMRGCRSTRLRWGAYGTHNTLGLTKKHRARFLLASTARSTVIRSSIPSGSPIGGTSTRSARAGSTTRRSATRKR